MPINPLTGKPITSESAPRLDAASLPEDIIPEIMVPDSEVEPEVEPETEATETEAEPQDVPHVKGSPSERERRIDALLEMVTEYQERIGELGKGEVTKRVKLQEKIRQWKKLKEEIEFSMLFVVKPRKE